MLYQVAHWICHTGEVIVLMEFIMSNQNESPSQWHETIKHYDVDGVEYTLIAQIDVKDSGRYGVGYYFQWEDQHSLFQPVLSIGGATLDEAIKNAHNLIDTSAADEDYLLEALIGVQMTDRDFDEGEFE